MVMSHHQHVGKPPRSAKIASTPSSMRPRKVRFDIDRFEAPEAPDEDPKVSTAEVSKEVDEWKPGHRK